MSECFIETLRRLKESSKEAVENIESFSEFKQYMHIKRRVEDELLELIEKASNSTASQLILVCGGVGDGKSHLISYLKKKFPELINTFKIHNDATESFEPQKTSMDTLNDELSSFSDENLDASDGSKLILAINLGTLNNFIDSEYGKRYSKLAKFVYDKEILVSSIISEDNSFDCNSNFHYINFSDYHMYTLTPDGPKSEYMSEVLNKITGQDINNPFYKEYSSSCLQHCSCANDCPVKLNYELLAKKTTQERIISILIEAMIKYKLILSTRELLNFIYDIIVSNYIDTLATKELKKLINELGFSYHIKFLIPNLIFEHEDLSPIFKTISKLDPVNLRCENRDQIIIKFNTIKNIVFLYNEHIEMLDYPHFNAALAAESVFLDSEEQKQELVKLFFRLYLFSPKTELLEYKDTLYQQYMRYLYYYNVGDKVKIKTLYFDIKESIYKWNGENEKDYINLFIGKNKLRYKISQKLNLTTYTGELIKRDNLNLNKFITNFILVFKVDGEGNAYPLDIDYPLYCLLMDIKNGYRPNKKDRSNYISFATFVDKVLEFGQQNKELLIAEKTGDAQAYKLIYDYEFDQYTFERI